MEEDLLTNAGTRLNYLEELCSNNVVNFNLVQTMGLDRVELLKDGASAIYGADAVAGVINNVLLQTL